MARSEPSARFLKSTGWVAIRRAGGLSMNVSVGATNHVTQHSKASRSAHLHPCTQELNRNSRW